MGNNLVKIPMMAEELEVSYKTLYTWIENGYLEMVQPGYVERDEAYQAKRVAQVIASEIRREKAMNTPRDKRGRWA